MVLTGPLHSARSNYLPDSHLSISLTILKNEKSRLRDDLHAAHSFFKLRVEVHALSCFHLALSAGHFHADDGLDVLILLHFQGFQSYVVRYF